MNINNARVVLEVCAFTNNAGMTALLSNTYDNKIYLHGVYFKDNKPTGLNWLPAADLNPKGLVYNYNYLYSDKYAGMLLVKGGGINVGKNPDELYGNGGYFSYFLGADCDEGSGLQYSMEAEACMPICPEGESYDSDGSGCMLCPDTADHCLGSQAGLHARISSGGSSLMEAGSVVVLMGARYFCGTCEDSSLMYSVMEMYGTIMCDKDDGSCILDGIGSKQIASIKGTEGEVRNKRSAVISRLRDSSARCRPLLRVAIVASFLLRALRQQRG